MINIETLRMGTVELFVKDLLKMKLFYNQMAGIPIVTESNDFLELGYENNILLRFIKKDNYLETDPNEAGLYHTAIVFPSQIHLANSINKVLSINPSSYQGSADHGATEAFYFSDPEGNGVELYYDKPRDQWEYKNGKPLMGSEYIDEQEYIQKYKTNESLERNIKIGHVHLQVGNIQKAKEFYVDMLGFELMFEMPTALFVARDGYHHHLGLNVWNSNGVGSRTPNMYGLASFEIVVKDQKVFEQIENNLKLKNYTSNLKNNRIEIGDLWETKVIISKEL
jgi:catechol 2,3-dioxygenase